VRVEGLGQLKMIHSPHRVSNPRPSGLYLFHIQGITTDEYVWNALFLKMVELQCAYVCVCVCGCVYVCARARA
jgi:hypothetical protein